MKEFIDSRNHDLQVSKFNLAFSFVHESHLTDTAYDLGVNVLSTQVPGILRYSYS